MDLDKIELKNLTKNFEYCKLSSQIDNCQNLDEVKSIAKAFCKLYFKQQETMSTITY